MRRERKGREGISVRPAARGGREGSEVEDGGEGEGGYLSQTCSQGEGREDTPVRPAAGREGEGGGKGTPGTSRVPPYLSFQ